MPGRVHAAGRFVEQKSRRIVDDACARLEARCFHAGGVFFELAIASIAEIKIGEHLAEARRIALFAGHAVEFAGERATYSAPCMPGTRASASGM